MVGRYALFDAIASGGMATVHLGRALDPTGLGKVVAVKRLHVQFAEDAELVSMFLDEARVATRIHHPNVVPMLDVVNADGELLLVMEYIRGEPLSRLVRVTSERKEPIAPPIAASIMAGVLHGLHAAHEACGEDGQPLGIIHRDVSPHNIMVGIDGIPRVLDFGVAKASNRVQSMTRPGQLKGKVPYMSPEQLHGKPVRATDVYAVSVVLWEALAARRLFTAPSEPEIVRKVMEGKVDPPGAFGAGIPPELDAIVLRGLQRDPLKRFETAREMALALEAVFPAVPASRVGRWVETTCAESIGRLGERVAQIERVTVSGLRTAFVSGDFASEATFSSYAARADRARLRRRRLVMAIGGAALLVACLTMAILARLHLH